MESYQIVCSAEQVGDNRAWTIQNPEPKVPTWELQLTWLRKMRYILYPLKPGQTLKH